MSTDIEFTMRLSRVAMEVYSVHGAGEDAITVLQERIQEDVDLLNQILKDAARDAIAAAVREARRKLSTGKEKELKTYSEEVRESVRNVCESLFEWRLIGGLRLADATREDLLVCSNEYQNRIDGNKRNQAFVEAVASKLQAGRKVSECLTESQLRRLMEKSRKV